MRRTFTEIGWEHYIYPLCGKKTPASTGGEMNCRLTTKNSSAKLPTSGEVAVGS